MISIRIGIAAAAAATAPLLCTGCVTPGGTSQRTASCRVGDLCTVQGLVEPTPAHDAWMGVIRQPDESCTSISFPEATIGQLRRDGPTPMTVSGRVIGYPADTNQLSSLKVNGRTIGVGTGCGDVFIYVRE